MGRISDHCLVEISNLDVYLPVSICYGSEIADVTVATYPNRGTARDCFDIRGLEPFVKVAGIATHVGMCRTRHLQALAGSEDSVAIIETYKFANLFHKRE